MQNLEDKSQSREINGVTYRSWPLPWGVGRPLLVRLIHLLSPLLSEIFKAQNAQEQAMALFSALPQALSDGDLQSFARAFGQASKFVSTDGKEIPLIEGNQADHFGAKYLEFFQWLTFNMEVNFSGFFTGLKGAGAADALLNMMAPKV